MLTKEDLAFLVEDQKDEITAHHIYKILSEIVKDEENSRILKHISDDELIHYNRLKSMTHIDVEPSKWDLFKFKFIAKYLGLTFSVRLLEKGESDAQDGYGQLSEKMESFRSILKDEERHEQELIDIIDEEKLNYMGSVVLGLNDALVELTGALAGYTFAFQNTKLIALTGLITGISASFSMAASEYLSSREDEDPEEVKTAKKSAVYTGIAYIFTVMALIMPFLIISNPFVSLIVTILVAVAIIFFFNFYVAVAKNLDFKRRFLEMSAISIGVAAISFVIGIIVKEVFGIEI